MKIAVIGAGNGGQAIAGYIASMGHDVRVYDRCPELIKKLTELKSIKLSGCINDTVGEPTLFTNDIASAVKGVEIIMIATTATGHKDVAYSLARFIEDNQYIILNPGRTCGALEFKKVLNDQGVTKKYFLAEAQTLIYACRLIETGSVNIIGIKDRVLLSALPASDTKKVIEKLSALYHCFFPAKNVLRTSFENIGAMFHPAVVLFNEASIERGFNFYFYRDMTPALSNMIETLDAERLAVAKAYGIDLISAKDWISYAYEGVEGDTLCERMQNNPAYSEILAPTTINCRQIFEDIPTGIIPMSELGKVAGVKTPVMDALITMCSVLHQKDYMQTGRTLKALGLGNMNIEEILNKIEHHA